MLRIKTQAGTKLNTHSNIGRRYTPSFAFFTHIIICSCLLVYSNTLYAGLPKEKKAQIELNPWDELRKIIQALKPYHRPPYYEPPFNTIVLAYNIEIPELQQFYIGQQQINYFQFICVGSTLSEYPPQLKTAFYTLFFMDGEFKTYTIDANQYTQETLLTILHSPIVSGEIEEAFVSDQFIGTHRRIINFDFKNGYVTSEQNIYNGIIKHLLSKAVQEIRSTPSLEEKMNNGGITLLSLGCGTGNHLAYASNYFASHLESHVQAFGSDISDNLIETARSRHSNIQFFVDNALTASNTVAQCIQLASEGSLFIVVTLGLINETVLDGTYTALQVLQQLANTQAVDLLLISGLTRSLLTREMAENAGWNMKKMEADLSRELIDAARIPNLHNYRQSYGVNIYIHLLTPTTLEEQEARVILQSQRRSQRSVISTLDLAMNSYPDQLFPAVIADETMKEVTNVDLSWSLLPGNYRNFLQTLVLWGVQKIVVSGFEPWFDTLKHYIATHNLLSVLKRVDSRYPGELPSLPIYIARQVMPSTSRFTSGVFKKKEASPPGQLEAESRKETRQSFLPQELRSIYLKKLHAFLIDKRIRTISTPKDGFCLLHSLGLLLNLSAEAVQQTLFDAAYQLHSDTLPDEILTQITNDILDENWADTAYLALAAIAFNKKILLISANPGNGQIQFQLFTPNAQGTTSTTFPEGLDLGETLIIIHNAQGHFLAGSFDETSSPIENAIHNQQNLVSSDCCPSPATSHPRLEQVTLPTSIPQVFEGIPQGHDTTSLVVIMSIFKAFLIAHSSK